MLIKAGVFAAVVLADTSASASGGIPSFANYGIIGVLLGAIIVGKMLVPRWTYDDLKAEKAKVDAENQRLHELIETQSVPALTEATLAVKDSQAWSADMKREIDNLKQINIDLQRKFSKGDDR